MSDALPYYVNVFNARVVDFLNGLYDSILSVNTKRKKTEGGY